MVHEITVTLTVTVGLSKMIGCDGIRRILYFASRMPVLCFALTVNPYDGLFQSILRMLYVGPVIGGWRGD